MDFVSIETEWEPKTKGGGYFKVYPRFLICPTKDLMVRGKSFYAVWDDVNKKWSTSEQTVIDMIDSAIRQQCRRLKDEKGDETPIRPMYMSDGDSRSIDKWNHYVTKQMYDIWEPLDSKIVFLNDPEDRGTLSSHRLPYALIKGDISNYDKLVSVLYTPEERHKFEWAIGAVISGDAKWIQKFIVFVGDHGTGKSTILKIIRWLFQGYVATINAKAIGSSSNSFALDTLKDSPLVAIEDDTDLSHIEDNTRINSIVSHEPMAVNEKFKSSYTQSFQCMIFLGTNKEVQITDSRSGLIRRLIDVKPSGKKLPPKEYRRLLNGVEFELGAIAEYCLRQYDNDPYYYDGYVPTEMMRSTNITYSWLEENMAAIVDADGISLSRAWASYKQYCDDADILYKLNKQKLKNELKGYFEEYIADGRLDDGTRVYNYFKGFKIEKMGKPVKQSSIPAGVAPYEPDPIPDWLKLSSRPSKLDIYISDCPAQYSNGDKPERAWDDCTTKVGDLDTSREHYVLLPKQMIFIDFDCRGPDGKKSREACIKAASAFPKTYVENSKGGNGLHLHYIYEGDVNKLSSLYSEHIEIKISKGKSSCRRRLIECNDLDIATINSGLPLKEEASKVLNQEVLDNAKALETLVLRAMQKHYPPHSTVCNVDFVAKKLKEAYDAGVSYDLRPYRPAFDAFAAKSTNNARHCCESVMNTPWCSDDYLEDDIPPSVSLDAGACMVFYDVEVFPNLFVVCWKKRGNNPMVKWINPSADQVSMLFDFKLIGFNNRRYDNHILWAAAMGYTNMGLYELSKSIIGNTSKGKDQNCFFSQAYGISYTDIYDYASKKQSLKKWEIELKIHHQELGFDWNEPVPEDKWHLVAEYCANDVEATEAVFDATQADYVAREMLAALTGGTPNDTTNSLSAKLIFGSNNKPQGEFIWRDLSKPVKDLSGEMLEYFEEVGLPMPFDSVSLLPYFHGYTYDGYKSFYKGIDVGEGGEVYAEPGIYYNVALIDVTSMHPHSAIMECVFGPRYTRIFRELVYTRVAIKNGDFEKAKTMFDGRLAPYLEDTSNADNLAQALKIVINSVYGLTAAHFENRFRDPNNIDNIVAKRGALFMIDLKEAVEAKGFKVAHIKTDSIKIPNATPEIIEFCKEFAQRYGYSFDHEATYERMCLVNDAVYIAKYATKEACEALYGYIPKDCKKHPGQWTATGTQFAVPYVFKTLFSKEEIEFDDMCETKSVKNALYLDTGTDDEPKYQFIGRVGQFTPVIEGVGGGKLMSLNNGKYSAATGTKGYLWLESESIRNMGNVKDIVNRDYYRALVDKARDAINKYGDCDDFVSFGGYPWMDDELPF